MTHPEFEQHPDFDAPDVNEDWGNDDDMPEEMGGVSPSNDVFRQISKEANITMAVTERIKHLESIKSALAILDHQYADIQESIDLCKEVLSDYMGVERYNETLDELYNRG